VTVDDVAAVREVLDEPQPRPPGAQQARQRRLAGLKRLAPENPDRRDSDRPTLRPSTIRNVSGTAVSDRGRTA